MNRSTFNGLELFPLSRCPSVRCISRRCSESRQLHFLGAQPSRSENNEQP